MKVANLIGKPRVDLGSAASNRLRAQGLIPCMITRKEGNVNFYSFINDFSKFIFTPDTYVVNITVEGVTYKTLVQESQFNPLSDEVRHVDFLEVNDNEPVKCELPIKITGTSKGILAGGKLVSKLRRLKVKGLIPNMPEYLTLDITELDLGKSVKVKELSYENLEILNDGAIPIATIEVPRALRGKV